MSSLQRYLFDGSYRSRPYDKDDGMQQDNREAFLERVQLDRERRALERKQNNSAVKIQSWIRSFNSRQRVKNQVRRIYDQESGSVKNGDLASLESIERQTKRLGFFFHPSADGERLKWLCKQLLRRRDQLVSGAGASRELRRFLRCCVAYLSRIANDPEAVFAPVLRSIQVFGLRQDDTTGEVVVSVVDAGYLRAVLALFVSRVALPAPRYRIVSPKMPSPLAESLFEALIAPLKIGTTNLQLRRYLLSRFCVDVLSSANESVRTHCICHIVPAIAEICAKGDLPLSELLSALLPADWPAVLESAQHLSRFRLSAPEYVDRPLLLYALLCIVERFPLESLPPLSDVRIRLLWTVAALLPSLKALSPTWKRSVSELEANYDEDEDEGVPPNTSFADVRSAEEPTVEASIGSDAFLVQRCVRVVESAKFIHATIGAVLDSNLTTPIRLVASLCYTTFRLRAKNRFSSPLLYPLSFRRKILRSLWPMINSCRGDDMQTLFGPSKSPFEKLQMGERPTDSEKNEIFPLTSLFCALLTNVLFAVHDDEFYADERQKPLTSMVPFSNGELRRVAERMRNLALGLIDLAYPESRFDLGSRTLVATQRPNDAHEWADLLEQVFRVLQSLHERDSRIRFCPEGMWSNHKRQPIVDREMSRSFATSRRLRRQRRGQQIEGAFGFVRWMTHEEAEAEGGARPTSTELRNVMILRRVPFVVPFLQRVDVLRQMIERDRSENGREMDAFAGMGGIPGQNNIIVIHVRRTHIYEDSYSALSPQSAPNLKQNLRVSMSNWAGAEEAGIDGGGIFREFMSELLKAGFDPNRGLFMATQHTRQIYPNPSADMIEPEWQKHFYFLGRMFGKLIYENQLAELHFASFFLAKLLHRNAANVDVHHLQSLDDTLYRNLLHLQSMTDAQDVDALHLDFSILIEKFGGTLEKIDLKPAGRDIRVTIDNRLEYVHLVADFYLNKQLDKYTRWFRHGLSQVVDLDWLAMFDRREVETLVSGTDADIDLNDMRAHTHYSGGAVNEGSEPVVRFWRVVESLSGDEKRLLLKFITGCSRPPLMGFRDLFPPLAIQLVGEGAEGRLPTAATCMNLLKLPVFPDDATLAAKLRYAINSGAGFELS